MATAVRKLLDNLKDPMKEMHLIRHGLKVEDVESYLKQEQLMVKDILENLDISPSTYFNIKKQHKLLDPHASEKFVRLINVLTLASEILGKVEARKWLYKNVPSLGNEVPVSLLDTETGHRLVEQALLQIQYGIYS